MLGREHGSHLKWKAEASVTPATTPWEWVPKDADFGSSYHRWLLVLFAMSGSRLDETNVAFLRFGQGLLAPTWSATCPQVLFCPGVTSGRVN